MESNQEEEYLNEFKELVLKDVAVPVSAMKTLISVIKRSTSTTWMQLEHELRTAIKLLKQCSANDLLGRTKISLGSGCDLFMKYVTRSFLEFTVSFSVLFFILKPIRNLKLVKWNLFEEVRISQGCQKQVVVGSRRSGILLFKMAAQC
jgi:hypothetical protein